MADGPIISIEGLEKRFSGKNTDVFALRGIDLAIGRGDIFGIIGKSGAGKSTLVRCINMLERPTGGSVFFEGPAGAAGGVSGESNLLWELGRGLDAAKAAAAVPLA